MEKQIIDAARLLGQALLADNLTVTCAESCTGGGVASAITDIPGSSQWFPGGVVTYSNTLKHQWLGVSPGILESEGAVSQAVVEQMAEGVRKSVGADFSVAISGIAGPDGGSKDKPVGTVWFAWSSREKTETKCCHFDGDRHQVRQRAILQALNGLLEICK